MSDTKPQQHERPQEAPSREPVAWYRNAGGLQFSLGEKDPSDLDTPWPWTPLYTLPLRSVPAEKLEGLAREWKYQVELARDSAYKRAYEKCADELLELVRQT